MPPAIPELGIAGFAAALVMALTDFLFAVANREGQLVGVWEMAQAGAFLVSLYLVPGVALGAAIGLLVAIVRRTPWLAPIRVALRSRHALREPRPELFATTVAALPAVAIFVLAVGEAHLHFATRYHRADLAAYALAAAVLGLALACVLLTAALAIPLRPIARRIGRVASALTLIVAVALAALAAAVVFFALRPEVLDAYGIPAIAFVPASLIALAATVAIVRRALRRASSLRAWAALVAVALVSASALWLTSRVYGASNEVRGVVEERSIAGQRLVREYQRRLDRDGDGHASGFGGEDCDDDDPRVYPGARETDGDRVDSDCFAGDSSPDVSEEGDGRYGRVPGAISRPSFVVFTIDALRPDHLSGNGYGRPTSPHIDAFLAESVVFERAYASSSRSIRSVPGMWSGFYPSQIAYGDEFLFPSLDDDRNVMVPEQLARHGYRRTVVMGTDYFYRCNDFFQGWDDVDQIMIYKPPRARPVDDALARLPALAASSSPFILWVHLFNVHGPWLQDGVPSDYGQEPTDLYDTEIRLADEQFQRMLDGLDAFGLRQRTVVILASDHGEQLMEHGEIGHATTVHQEEILSTLAIRAPGVPPRRVPGAVSLIDLAPTILNLANVPMPRPGPARSLVPQMLGEPTDRSRRIFGELVPDGFFPYDQRYVLDGDLKLIWYARDGRFQLFDLATDPLEQRDLSAARPDDLRRLRGILRAWVAQAALDPMDNARFVAEHRLPGPPVGISTPMEVVYPGLFTFLGADLPQTSFAPGDSIPLDLFFRADEEIEHDLYIRVDVTGPPGYRVLPHVHGNHYPLLARYHTSRWRPGEHLRDPVHIVIPSDQRAPVRLTLTMSVWDTHEADWRLLEGLSAGRSDSSIRLGEIELRSPAGLAPP